MEKDPLFRKIMSPMEYLSNKVHKDTKLSSLAFPFCSEGELNIKSWNFRPGNDLSNDQDQSNFTYIVKKFKEKFSTMSQTSNVGL